MQRKLTCVGPKKWVEIRLVTSTGVFSAAAAAAAAAAACGSMFHLSVTLPINHCQSLVSR